MSLLHNFLLRLEAMLLFFSLASFSTITYAQLANRKALSNAIEIKLPAGFKFMEGDILATKYPPNNKPSEVYTNEDATVNIAFKKTVQSLAEQNVFTEGKRLEQQLINGGRIQLISSEQIKANGNNTHVFSFYSNAIDTKVYNVMFVFSLKGKMVVGSFNCTIALQNQWQSTAYEIVRSIREI
jgi:hypothetical protein